MFLNLGEGRLEDDRGPDDSIDGVSVVSDAPAVPDVPSPFASRFGSQTQDHCSQFRVVG